MEPNGKMEREINLVELIWNILFSWRKIICSAIIFAVIFTGGKYLRDRSAFRMSLENDSAHEEIQLTAEEQEQVENAKTMMSRIENYQKYLDESALMQIDPYEKPVVELQYYVKSDYTYNYTRDNQSDYTGDIMALYCNYVRSGEMSDKVIKAAKLSISQADFSELCYATQNGNTMAITIAWTDIEKLDEISDLVKNELIQKEKDFQEVGSHKLRLLRESKNVVADTDLAERKNLYSNNVANINMQLNTMRASMSEQQLKLLQSEEDPESKDDEILILEPSINKKYMLVGFVFGMFLICLWTVIKVIFNEKLQVPEEICTLFNIRVLGEISSESDRKRFLSIFDDKLLAIKNRRKKKLSREWQIKRVVANVSLTCKQQNIEKIYMTGSDYEDIDTKTLDMLKTELAVQNVQVVEGGNIFYDADSLKAGAEIGYLLFVERAGKSIYDEISNEINLAKEYRNYIIGFIVLV